MPATTRRALLGALSALVVTGGCLELPAGQSTPTATSTPEPCSAERPPKPTGAATDPRPYPERPAELTRESVRSFVEAYERAYQYNSLLAEHPRKIGRLNDLDVSVNEVSVTVADGAFSADVSGQANTSITVDGESTPETPTQTPLPMGHWPFEATYLVSDRRVRREGTVYECW